MAEPLIAGRYRLETLLGRGGMSEVWCAADLELGRRVALKLLAPNEDIARFEREARAVAALGHPNVTQLYDYGEDAGRPFMVLEYLPGGSLEELLQAGGALSDPDTQRISSEIAAGLAHAHARGVVHRDLKPSNVLFDDEGHAKLADFGIARMATGEGTLTEAGTVLGTAAYISPEQASGFAATAASDVYSCGVILFRMLTGRLPFESDDPLALVLLHRDQPAPRVTDARPDAPPALAATTTAALSKDPGARPQDGAALADALAQTAPPALADTAVTSVLPTVPAASGPGRRSRFGITLAGAALVLLALAGAVLAYKVSHTGDPPPPAKAGTLGQGHTVKSHTHPTTANQTPTTTTHTATGHTTTAHTTTAATTTPTTTRHTTTRHHTTPPPPLPPVTTYAPTTTVNTTTTTTQTTTTPPPTTTPTTAPATTAPPTTT